MSRVVGAAEDITERKQFEDALRESQTQLQLSTNAPQMAIWSWNVRTGEVFLSPLHDKFWSLEEPKLSVQSEDWLNRVHQDDLRTARETIEEAQKRGSG